MTSNCSINESSSAEAPIRSFIENCGDFLHRKLLDGAYNLDWLYERQLRHRFANLRLMLVSSSGHMEAELQVHAAQSARLLSSAVRTRDALQDSCNALEILQRDMQEMYPGNSAVEPARGLNRVTSALCQQNSSVREDFNQLVAALKLHCDEAIPAIVERVKELKASQDEATLCEADENKLRKLLQEANQQAGFLWDSLRVKLHRIVAQMVNHVANAVPSDL